MQSLKKILLLTIIVFGYTNAGQFTPEELIADNGVIKLKFDLSRGGTISYVSLSGSERNLVNTFDEGRYIQQSYYAGRAVDRKDEGQSPRWSPWAWNPIQAGDDFKNRAKILEYKESSETLYTRCIPMLWDMNNMPAEAIMEQWAILNKNIIKIHNKLTCTRTDTIYGENILSDQELPAVYPVSALSKLYFYTGDKPFSNDALSNPEPVLLSSGFWGRYPEVTEHWMAFTDSSNWGIGVYNPQSVHFLAGMAGKPGGETKDGSTSYIAPVKQERLKKDSVYEYDYYLIVGSVEEIRKMVYQLEKGELKF